MKVYLSSPYEFSRAKTQWKDQVGSILASVDDRFQIIDPCPLDCAENDIGNKLKDDGDWLAYYSYCVDIVHNDLSMLRSCQGMVAYLPHRSITHGTIHEIAFAVERNIPVVLVSPEGKDKVSRWLWGVLGPNRIFDSIDEAVSALAHRVLIADGSIPNGKIYHPSRAQTDG